MREQGAEPAVGGRYAHGIVGIGHRRSIGSAPRAWLHWFAPIPQDPSPHAPAARSPVAVVLRQRRSLCRARFGPQRARLAVGGARSRRADTQRQPNLAADTIVT